MHQNEENVSAMFQLLGVRIALFALHPELYD